jgi:hypothetical protein
MGALLVTGTAAQADWNSSHNAGFLNGSQTSLSVHVPIDVSGNALAIGGFASANSNGDSAANKASAKASHKKGKNGGAMANSNGGGWSTGYNAGILNGGQTNVSVSAPITVCGNAIAIFGFASASC